jgi:hypothetical protein
MFCGKRDYQVALSDQQRVPANDQTASAARERADRAFDLAGIAYCERAQGHAKRARDALDCSKLRGSSTRRILQHRRSRHVRRQLLEQLQPFPACAEFGRGKTGRIAAWSRHTFHYAGTNRLGNRHEHDRDDAG